VRLHRRNCPSFTHNKKQTRLIVKAVLQNCFDNQTTNEQEEAKFLEQDQTNKTIGYFCPSCRQPVMGSKTLFALAASPTKITCDCGRSHGEIVLTEDKFRLTVPCLFCGKTHTVEGSLHHFLEETLAFSCKTSGLACCFVGSEEKVGGAMARLQETVEKLGTKPKEGGAVFLDPLVMEEVLEEIKEIAKRDGISCTCGSHQWRMDVKYSAIDLICAKCGGAVRIPAATQDDIDDICCKDRILMKKV
jgi:hypothetical protein